MTYKGNAWREATRAGALILDRIAKLSNCAKARSEARLAHISVIADARAEAKAGMGLN